MDKLKYMLYGFVYMGDEELEIIGWGGYKCQKEMTLQYKLSVMIVSTAIQALIIFKLKDSILNSLEFNFKRIKNLNPSPPEKFIGYICLVTYIIQFYYKLVSGALIFMLSPCHMVLLMQTYLLLSKKTKFSTLIFISCLRWIFGAWGATLFPDTKGYSQLLEVENFWLEHYVVSFVGIQIIILFGRYGFHFQESIIMFLKQQIFGVATMILFHRLIYFPIGVLAYVNINYQLCHCESDPTYHIFGQSYYYVADFFFNFLSLITTVLIILQVYIIKIFLTQINIIKNDDLYIDDEKKTYKNK